MKKNVILLSVILIGFALISNATVWRLNNIPGVDAHLKTTLQNAIDSIQSGDTIYVEQSPFNYGSAVISKQVFLFGAGYWLEANDSTRVNKEKSQVEEIIFETGSEGSEMMGMYCYKVYPNKSTWELISVNTDNITIKRNYIFGRMTDCYMSGCSGILIGLNGNRMNIDIEQNWLECFHTFGPCSPQIGAAIHINGIPSNVSISHNFIKSNVHSILESVSYPTTELTVSNNIIWGAIYTFVALHINNILIDGSFYNGSGGLTANNLCNGNQYPEINNNQLNIDMSTVFIDHDLYIDNGYILVSGSPAIEAGFTGGDCGVFGSGFGGNPYVLSGMVAIPAIYEIELNSTVFPSSSNTLEVNLKAKSHN